MRFAGASGLAIAASSLLFSQFASAQTSTKCNPLHQTCPPDPALGTTKDIEFSSGQDSNDFDSAGNGISYDSQGLHLTVAKSGDSPTLTSKWYLMFGRIDVELQAAPGTGIVSSFVLQSDDLDEIDWEFLGSQSSQVQTNYFGKGMTGSYDRGTTVGCPNCGSQTNTFTIEWTSTQVVWQINGQTVRVLNAQDAASGQYPQTPLQIKIGAWAGGDSTNAPGVISWAGGPTDYSQGPFTMLVKSVKAQDYSTGTQYTYGDNSGSWGSIKSNGGSINSGGSSVDSSSAPVATFTTSGQPVPFSGTHAEPKSDQSTPSGYPWSSSASGTTSSDPYSTSIAGLPSGWTVSSDGKVMPPSSAPSTYPAASPTPSPSASPSGAPGLDGSSDGSATPSPSFPMTSGPAATPSSSKAYGGSPAAGGVAGGAAPGGGAAYYAPPYPNSMSGFSSTPSNSSAPTSTKSSTPSYTGAAANHSGYAGLAAVVAGAFACLAFTL